MNKFGVRKSNYYAFYCHFSTASASCTDGRISGSTSYAPTLFPSARPGLTPSKWQGTECSRKIVFLFTIN